MAAALKQLRGAFALAFLFAGEDDLMIGARKGSPLAIGYGKGEMYLGSDAIALAPFTDTSQLSRGRRLGGGDAQGRRQSATRRAGRSSARSSSRPPRRMMVDKGNHKHFMAKEIHEQPEVVGHTLAHYIDMVTRTG